MPMKRRKDKRRAKPAQDEWGRKFEEFCALLEAENSQPETDKTGGSHANQATGREGAGTSHQPASR